MLDRSAGQDLGVVVGSCADDSRLEVRTLKPGLVYDWNMKSKSEVWIMPGDHIIEANGVSGCARLLLQECGKKQLLNLRIRPMEKDGMPPACVTDNAEVLVHVYDLGIPGLQVGSTVNALTTRFGIFHTGVEVYGREWYFCGGGEASFHGVYAMPEPRQHPHHTYRRTVSMGRTELPRDALEDLMPRLRLRWPRWTYHVVRRNCHHFVHAFCQMLGFPAGPCFGIFGAGDRRLAAEPVAPGQGILGCCSGSTCVRAGKSPKNMAAAPLVSCQGADDSQSAGDRFVNLLQSYQGGAGKPTATAAAAPHRC